ncbi:MAG: sigma 54-interacting transcriptional regulator, partial [bacterium]
KLLRVLQENVVEPVGAEQPRPVDVRLIAATNVDLRERVRSGRFREDLFYRLNVVPLRVPSLRERPEDIPLLAREFVKKHSPQHEVTLLPGLIERLLRHNWPGNVRELENLIERMMVLRHGDELDAKALPADFGEFDPRQAATANAEELQVTSLAQVEREAILRALERSGGNKSKAAKLLNVPRHVLIYRLKKYDLY